MSNNVSTSREDFQPRFWQGDSAWVRMPDVLAVLVAICLPWSTSLVAIFIVLWVLSLLPTFNLGRFVQTLKRPESFIPVGLAVLSVMGMLWATDIPWAARMRGINPAMKFLLIPLLIYHFENSKSAAWVFAGFIASCAALMIVSWVLIAGRWQDPLSPYFGIPVKDYIAQNHEFALCAFALMGLATSYFRERRPIVVLAMIALTVLFLANIFSVTVSRTILVSLFALFMAFCWRFFTKKEILLVLVAAAVVASATWTASSRLRERVVNISSEYRDYSNDNASTSTGLRLEYWRKSLRFIEQAPFVGNGTGSIRTLFERDAVGKTGVSSEVIGNPHNQTLNVMVQWGMLGAIVLWAMWIAHFYLFVSNSFAAWIGLIVVLSNVVSSLFNSHLFDFTQGWIYVVAVGVAAGVVRGRQFRAGNKPSVAHSEAMK